ncbi:Golgi to ER traffic protein 4 homolog [Contarinia nasturtii]|uniref:Golgi to ER traffic protein 4 homolog n=1 Tax=Contarinia nasturtii TaxID=265458 RepID=UPI0012D431DD|nr:Golgi to ER traffic protein 4 homolog [Contarinia nasturtii]
MQIKSVKWSSEISKNKMGHPTIHKVIAQLMWSEGNLEQARHHFLLSKDGSGCGQMLIELSQTKGFPKEADLFITQVVLQQLCLKEISSAAETFHTYIKFHPKISRTDPPFVMPLLNFVFFLLKIIGSRKLAIFKKLCELYKPSLDRDPSYEKYLEKIGVIFFGAPNPPQRSNNGIFGDLINQLFQGLEDEDDENQTCSSVETDLD